MPKFEDDRRKIVSRLESEGWHNIGGGEHDNFGRPQENSGASPTCGYARRGALDS
ncbi:MULTISPECIES: hypothetical protein [Sinorhizobium]|uniref:Type II toxin-antitoxin system HicA family toxin n=1 Tax=Sinorhizobium kummerowiae TaxID=158892 RepID=A0ABY8T5Q1_9HYPH|nr:MULTISPECIES: hypothetical protein [Sinorhizobium]UIJ95548.1 hypothetical protein LZK74_19175 [Sinorhizobium meliloti]WHS93102.1 hypothetical protein PZL22_004207 [Sinorhizobium kummerowiae]WKL31986.1 hypothetical protein Q1M65_18290 [Sinorhizobium meliloti]WQO42316.1 hypothetical protein U8C34_19675 [Sinorhizobium meliloti]WQO82665.1 hypothetical protein U8C44_19665 [Sinorhizobium meliloti]